LQLTEPLAIILWIDLRIHFTMWTLHLYDITRNEIFTFQRRIPLWFSKNHDGPW